MIRWQSEVLGAWVVAAAIILIATASVGRDHHRIPAIDIGTPHADVHVLERALMLARPEPEDSPRARIAPDPLSSCELAAAETGFNGC